MHILSAAAAVLAALLSASPYDASEPESIVANQNKIAAGVARSGVVRVALEAREGLWRPQADTGAGVVVQAFGEAGKPLQIPGPLLRVRSGSKLQITLRNTLQSELVVYGLHTRPGDGAGELRIAPGATQSVTFDAGAAGTYYYWGTTTKSEMNVRNGVDSQLNGAFVVDPASGPIPEDRIFVLGLWFSAGVKGQTPEREIMTINGKSWPNTERQHFKTGDSIRWRWINPTVSSHPMHLHGFYFTVKSRGMWAADTAIATPAQRGVATELMMPGATMDIEWQAQREGNWVFHCHFAFHVSDELYLAPKNASGHAEHGGKVVPHSMAGLVLGIHVAPGAGAPVAKSSDPVRRLRLVAQQRADTTKRGPRYGYSVVADNAQPHPDSMASPGPMLVLKRGQPVAITVINHLKEPTAVHWHGIELESFPDGVPGWSGTPARIMPPIAPGDSFIAEFIPPRAGTFMYHSHSNELGQILGGLVGPLVVLDNAIERDARDKVFLVSAAGTSPPESFFGLVNGFFEPTPRQLEADVTYRFRFINIGDWRVYFSLLDDKGFPPVRMIAKDGADLAEPVTGPLNLLTGPGETADFEVKLPRGNYRLEFKQALSGWIIPLELRVR
jgi:FtsP/CotA-like multicopper oxidase with cupredoxin domain